MVDSCQKPLVGVASRTTETSYKPRHLYRPFLPLPRPTALSCGPRAL
jgi:hypothetical protein